MNNSELKWIEDQLRPDVAPEPPEGLLERIQEDIPGHLQVVPNPDEQSTSAWKLRLLAASVVFVVIGGALVYRVSQQAPTLEESLIAEAETQPAPERVRSEEPAAPIEMKEVLAGKLEAVGRSDDAAKPSRSNQPPPRVQVESGSAVDTVSKAEHDRPASARVQDEEGESPGEGNRVQLEAASSEQTVVMVTSESPLLAETPKEKVHTPKKEDVVGYQGLEAQSPSELQGLYRMRVPTPEPQSDAARVRAYAAPSTGGTAEPNDAPYGDMFFSTQGTNPFVDTEDDPLSTFGLDVDTGSFTLARSYLDRGHLPPHEAIRVEEFVNYFDYGDPAPRRGEFTLVAEGARSPFATGAREHLVRFGIKARDIQAAERLPAVLIFVVDVSGSMQREDRLGLVKRSLGLLLQQLQPEDSIGLVVYGSRGDVLLEPTTNKDAIRRAIDRLVPGGSTNAEQGLKLAYDQARRYYREGAINRVILCSDGVANVGRTGADSILSSVRVAADEGIELTTVGFGMGNFNDELMEQLADRGDGSYAYVDTLEEARRIFVENLTGTLQTVASDAKVQVEFNPMAVSRYRLLGYENRDIADERFRDDTVDAGEIGAGHEVTALYEIKLHEGARRRDRLATLHLRYRSKATDEIVETDIGLKVKDLAPSWESSSSALQLSSLAAEFAEILKGSYWAKDSHLEEVHRRLQPLVDELSTHEQVEDLRDLVERALHLSSDAPN